MQNGRLYVYNLHDDRARFDTLTVQNGAFRYRGEIDEVTPYILLFPNGVEQVVFVGPGQDLEYEATANDLKNYVVNGSEENKLMNRFREETFAAKSEETKAVAYTYINENSFSPVALYLFERYFVQDANVNDKDVSQLIDTLKAKHPYNRYLLGVERRLAAARRCVPGKTLANVPLMDKNYKTVWLGKKAKSPRHLIVFWSTWMDGSVDFMWRLRRTTDSIRQDKKLWVTTVSLDVERYRWEDAVRPDTSAVALEHFCDGLAWESKAVKQLSVETLPCLILTDENQRVLERADDIAKLSEMLKKNSYSKP